MKRPFLIIRAFALLLILPMGNAAAVTLEVLLQTTAEKNPEIQKAKLDLERAYGRRLVLRSIAYPDAGIGAVGGVQGGYRAGKNSNTGFGFGYGGFTQPLFNAAIPASFRRGDIEVLIARQQLNVAMVEHLHAARLAFYTGTYSRSLKELREAQRERLQQVSSTQKARYEAGLAERGAFVGAEMHARELDARIEAAQRAYDGSVLQDALLMGDDLSAAGALPRLEGELTYQPVALDVDAETAKALQNRADLQLARLLVRAANEDQRIIEAAYYPAVNAVVGGEYIPVSGVRRQSEGSPKRSDDFISSEIREGVAYTWRVIDNGRISGAVLQQRSAREINELLLRKMEADVPRDLARIRNNLDGIAAKQADLIKATAAAELTTTAVRENLAGGVASQLEFRMAENASLEIKTALLDLAYQEHVALAEWDRATGKYFQFSNERLENVQ
jgi:outer membrane protein TolC